MPRQIIANCLSILRVPIGIIIFLRMMRPDNSNDLIILVAFICALISDYLDGRVARGGRGINRLETSTIGKWLDAFTDFILFFFIYLAFYRKGQMPGVLFALFLTREIMMYLWIRPTAMILKINHGAHLAGKVKTALQFVGVSILILIHHTTLLRIDPTIELKIITLTVFFILVTVSATSLIWYWKSILINWPKSQARLPQQLLAIVILLTFLQILIYIFLGPGKSTPIELIIIIIIYHIIFGSCIFWRSKDFKIIDNNTAVNKLTLPLILTFFRLSSIPTLVFLINYLAGQPFSFLIIGLLFTVLISDLFDGKIARKTKKVTKVGSYLDAISDYLALVLLSSTLFLKGLIPWWLWIAIVIRFSFTAIMTIFLSKSNKLSLMKPTFLGKFSVATVMLTMFLELITYSKFTTIAMLLTSGKNFNILIFIEIITLVIVLLSLANKVHYMTRLNQEK